MLDLVLGPEMSTVLSEVYLYLWIYQGLVVFSELLG